MGGGTLLIPLLTLGLSVNQQTAQLINLTAFLPMSLLALAVHIKNGYFVFQKIPYIIIPALVSSILGSYFATVTETDVLRKYFGGFLVILGTIYLFLSIFKAKSAGKRNS